jgi:nucleotide-binding universal stress UspA family protein
MATHGGGEDAEAILDSTTLHVVRHAPCPVLAMRPAALAG